MKKGILLMLVALMLVSVLAGCSPGDKGKDQVKNVDIKEVLDKIKEEMGEYYYPEMEMDFEFVGEISGIKEEDLEEYIVEFPLMTMSIDRFIAIKAKEGKGDTIEEGLLEYKRHMIEDEFKYPMNIPKVEASQVVRHGDYAFYLVLGAHDDGLEDIESKEAKDFAEKEVAKVVEIIDGFFK